MAEWETYAGETTVGVQFVWRDLYSPQLDNRRDIFLYVPPSYQTNERRYPVLYMNDGQNLFDASTSFSGEWRVDETMEQLAQEGREAIVVGVANSGEGRFDEYSPFRDRQMGGGRADAYLRFLMETVKPTVDDAFRTLPERAFTGIMGSSLGALTSFYAFFQYSDTFGFAGAMSPSVRFAGSALLKYVAQAPHVGGRIYVDFGTHELANTRWDQLFFNVLSRRYLRDVQRLVALLVEKGYRHDVDLRYVEEMGAVHEESAWARRLPNALRFLLPLVEDGNIL